MLAAEVFHWQPRIRFPEKPDDLSFRESLLRRPTLSLGRTLNPNATQIRGDVGSVLLSNTSVGDPCAKTAKSLAIRKVRHIFKKFDNYGRRKSDSRQSGVAAVPALRSHAPVVCPRIWRSLIQRVAQERSSHEKCDTAPHAEADQVWRLYGRRGATAPCNGSPTAKGRLCTCAIQRCARRSRSRRERPRHRDQCARAAAYRAVTAAIALALRRSISVVLSCCHSVPSTNVTCSTKNATRRAPSSNLL